MQPLSTGCVPEDMHTTQNTTHSGTVSAFCPDIIIKQSLVERLQLQPTSDVMKGRFDDLLCGVSKCCMRLCMQSATRGTGQNLLLCLMQRPAKAHRRHPMCKLGYSIVSVPFRKWRLDSLDVHTNVVWLNLLYRCHHHCKNMSYAREVC